MGIRLAQDWPVYIMLGAFVGFFVYMIIASNRQNKIEQQAKDKEKDKG